MKSINNYILEKFRISKNTKNNTKTSKNLIAVPFKAIKYFSSKYMDRAFYFGEADIKCFLVDIYDIYMDPHVSLRDASEVLWFKVPDKFSDIDNQKELEIALAKEKYNSFSDLEEFHFN